MAQLAIKGHRTRGKEVIQLLEMLGGENSCNLKGVETDSFYYICKDNDIYLCLSTNTENFIVFTLEEFEEKYPYKVGDKVIFGDIDNIVWEIESIQWVNNEIKYIIRDNNKSRLCDIKAEHLQPYKEENMEEPKELIIGFTKDDNGDWVLNTHKDYEIKEIEGKYKVIKKKQLQYPKIYIECCECLKYNPFINNVSGYKRDAIGALQTLITCRDAYWKIAGEQLGLDKPWKPDFTNTDDCYFAIKTCKGKISLISTLYIEDCILVFPTAEMRDAFYENFKDLIEQCKELL